MTLTLPAKTLTDLPPELLLLVASSLESNDLKSLSLTSRTTTRAAQQAFLKSLVVDGDKIYSFIGTPFDSKDPRGRLAALEDRGKIGLVRHLELRCITSRCMTAICKAERDGGYVYDFPSEDVFEGGDAIPMDNIIELIARLSNLREAEIAFPRTVPSQDQLDRIRPVLENLTILRLVIGKWDRQHSFLQSLLPYLGKLRTLDLRMVDCPIYKAGANPRWILDRPFLPKLTHLILRSPYYLSFDRYALFSTDLIPQITNLSIDFPTDAVNDDAYEGVSEEEVSPKALMELFGPTIQHLSLTYPLWRAVGMLEEQNIDISRCFAKSLAPLTTLQSLTIDSFANTGEFLINLPQSCRLIVVRNDFRFQRYSFREIFRKIGSEIGSTLRGRTLRLKSHSGDSSDFVQSWRICQQLGLNVEFVRMRKEFS